MFRGFLIKPQSVQAHEWNSWVLPRKPSQESRLRKQQKADSNIYYFPFFWGYPKFRSSHPATKPSGEPILGTCCALTAAVPQLLLTLFITAKWHLPLLSQHSSFALFAHWDSRAFKVAGFEWLTRKTKAMRKKCLPEQLVPECSGHHSPSLQSALQPSQQNTTVASPCTQAHPACSLAPKAHGANARAC